MRCLDTNAVIAVVGRRPPAFRDTLIEVLASGEEVGVPAIVLLELIYGIEKSDRRAKNETALRTFLALGVTLWSFELQDAEHAGAIRAGLDRLGTPIGPCDVLIAAQARRRGAVLVTANKREFERVPGLTVEDWAT